MPYIYPIYPKYPIYPIYSTPLRVRKVPAPVKEDRAGRPCCHQSQLKRHQALQQGGTREWARVDSIGYIWYIG